MPKPKVSSDELAYAVIEKDLIGCNIHYVPESGEFIVWTRRRDSDGWSMSGRHPDLALAISEAFDLDEIAHAVEDLI